MNTINAIQQILQKSERNYARFEEAKQLKIADLDLLYDIILNLGVLMGDPQVIPSALSPH